MGPGQTTVFYKPRHNECGKTEFFKLATPWSEF